jgi:hypothetical protein
MEIEENNFICAKIEVYDIYNEWYKFCIKNNNYFIYIKIYNKNFFIN